jgi:hypothetical protein
MRDQIKKKHAFLILAHKNMYQVGEMLLALDHPRCDFFVLIDQKCEEDFTGLKKYIKKGNLFFTKRISASWGGDTLIRAELILIEAATSKDHYEYYHFLSGQDFPLKPIDEILSFYDQHAGEEFISIDDNPKLITNRVKYYYPFQNKFNRNNLMGKVMRRMGIILQKIVRINRIDGKIQYGIGSQWFDITDAFARYVLSQKVFIKKYFKDGFCVDEIFLQTVYLNSGDRFKRYTANRCEKHPYIQDTYFDVCRAIDWTRGYPYIYTIEDVPMLMESGCLFARKFDFVRDPELLKALKDRIMVF